MKSRLYPVALATLAPIATAFAAQSPNIIFVITDDQGKGDLGCMGNPTIKTPNIDKFYSDAVRLDNYHVSTTSAPSRSSIMTGRHCDRLNVFHTIAGRSIIFEDEKLLPEILAERGYTNAMFGKWHLGDNYPNRPEDRGFDESVCLGGGGVGQVPDYWMNDYFDDTYMHNGVPQKYEGYCTDVFFREAMSFIERNSDRPFFCYLATNAPHSPFNVPEEYYNKYAKSIVNGKPINEDLRRFYGMISNIDDNFKELEKLLKRLKIEDNTILVFTTDNGTAAKGAAYNAGMKGHKGSTYEGGHRVPMFIRWKDGGISGGRDVEELVSHYDLLPTFMDLLSLDYTSEKKLDGRSLKPLLMDEAYEWQSRILVMDTQREQNIIKYKNYVVMEDDWRLVNGRELYDVKADLAQRHNIIEQHPDVVERLMTGYERWWRSLMDERVDERSAYIQVGSEHENPTKISSHDMYTGAYRPVWNQPNVLTANRATGYWKVEFLTTGDYEISLCRFPRESGLAINSLVDAGEKRVEIARPMPAAVKSDFTTAQLYVAGISKSAKIGADDREVTFKCHVSEGKYDLYAELLDKGSQIHPAYYLYIKKL